MSRRSSSSICDSRRSLLSSSSQASSSGTSCITRLKFTMVLEHSVLVAHDWRWLDQLDIFRQDDFLTALLMPFGLIGRTNDLSGTARVYRISVPFGWPWTSVITVTKLDRERQFQAYELLRKLDMQTSATMSQVAYGCTTGAGWDYVCAQHRKAFDEWMSFAATLDKPNVDS